MLEVILDTETTGLSTTEKHRIVEIGCIELNNQIPTDNIFHEYVNPQRQISEEAYKVHGYSEKFLADKKTFPQIVEDFLKFINGKKFTDSNSNLYSNLVNKHISKISSIKSLRIKMVNIQELFLKNQISYVKEEI